MFKQLPKTLLLIGVTAMTLSASDILVTVNGKNITKQDAQKFVTAASPNTVFAQLSKKDQEMIKERLIERVLFAEMAKKENIDNNPEFIKNVEMLKEELRINMWMKLQMDKVIVSDGEAKEFYEKNSAKFMQEAQAKARHILVKDEKEAQAIIDTLKPLSGKALKEKFIEMAKSKSTGPSASRGGDLGTFTKAQMVPAFSQAVWALEEGKITMKPVKTQFGYHVIFLENKMKAAPIAYKDVKEKIIAMLKQKQFASKMNEMSKILKSKAKIVDHTKKEKK